MLRVIEFFLLKWTRFAHAMAWAMVTAILSLTVAAGYIAATQLKVNTDTTSMLDPELSFQRQAKALRNAFPDIKNDVVIIVEGQTLDEVEALTKDLRKALLERSETFTNVFAPSADPFFMENGLLYLDDTELGDRLDSLEEAASLIETLVKTPTAGALFKTLANNDQLAEEADISSEKLQAIYAELSTVIEAGLQGSSLPFDWLGALAPIDEDEGDSKTQQISMGQRMYTRFVYTTPSLDYSRLQPAKPALRELNEILKRLSSGYDGRVTTYVTGDPALRSDELQSVTTGIGLSFGVSFLLVSILLITAYRSVYFSILTLTSLVITIILTSGFAAFTVGQLNLVSVAFTVLLVGLGLDFAIHLLLHVQERFSAGQSIEASLRGAVRSVGVALALAAPTTAIGFFAFMPTQFDGIAQLGLIAGVGVFIAFCVAVTFIPAALGAIAPPPPKQQSLASHGLFEKLESMSVPVAIVTIVVGIGALFLVPKARFDADPMALRDPAAASVIGFNRLFNDENTIPYRLTRLVSSKEEVHSTETKAKALSTVRTTRSLLDFIPDNQDDKLDRIDIAAGSLAFVLESDREPYTGNASSPTTVEGGATLQKRLSESYGPDTPAGDLAVALNGLAAAPERANLIETNIFKYWDPLVGRLIGQLNADVVALDTLPTHLKRRYLSAAKDIIHVTDEKDGKGDTASIWRVDILPKADVRDGSELKKFVDEVAAIYPDITGGAIQSQKAGEVISASMLQATSLALGVIIVFLWLFLGRPSDVAMMVFPLALAAVLTAAAGVILNIPFNYANVIVLPLLLGIGIDSGIHLVMRYRNLGPQTKFSDEASGDSTVFNTSTPKAIFFSTLTTVASFGSLMLSDHRGTASMGQLLSISIAFTLICTLIVLPAALKVRAARQFNQHRIGEISR
ncbi:MAG: MMPL family transporter [Pseudomonadota bacterium]